ncbi:MAG: hypothetical protein SGPRY_013204 [Prymnesium sp.]
MKYLITPPWICFKAIRRVAAAGADEPVGCIYEATGRALFDTLVNISSFWPHVVSLTSTIDSAKPVLRHPARPGELAGALQGTQE